VVYNPFAAIKEKPGDAIPHEEWPLRPGPPGQDRGGKEAGHPAQAEVQQGGGEIQGAETKSSNVPKGLNQKGISPMVCPRGKMQNSLRMN